MGDLRGLMLFCAFAGLALGGAVFWGGHYVYEHLTVVVDWK